MILRSVVIFFVSFGGMLYANDTSLEGKSTHPRTTGGNHSSRLTKSVSLFSAAMGAGFFLKEEANIGYFFKSGYDFDVNHEFSVVTDWNIVIDEDGNVFTDLSAGGRYFMGSDMVAGFAGANLGFGGVGIAKLQSGELGLTFGFEAGVQFFRQSDIHLDLAFNYKGHVKYNPNIIGFTLGVSAPVNTIM